MCKYNNYCDGLFNRDQLFKNSQQLSSSYSYLICSFKNNYSIRKCKFSYLQAVKWQGH